MYMQVATAGKIFYSGLPAFITRGGLHRYKRFFCGAGGFVLTTASIICRVSHYQMPLPTFSPVK